MCAAGGAKAWIEDNKKAALNSYMTPEVSTLEMGFSSLCSLPWPLAGYGILSQNLT